MEKVVRPVDAAKIVDIKTKGGRKVKESEYKKMMKDAGVKLAAGKGDDKEKPDKVKGPPDIHYLKLIAERLQTLINKFE